MPAILGPDSAFREIRESQYDYIEVINSQEAFNAILKLRDNIAFRQKWVNNGFKRGELYTHEANVRKWISFFEEYYFSFQKERLRWSFLKWHFYKQMKIVRARIRNWR